MADGGACDFIKFLIFFQFKMVAIYFKFSEVLVNNWCHYILTSNERPSLTLSVEGNKCVISGTVKETHCLENT